MQRNQRVNIKQVGNVYASYVEWTPSVLCAGQQVKVVRNGQTFFGEVKAVRPNYATRFNQDPQEIVTVHGVDTALYVNQKYESVLDDTRIYRYERYQLAVDDLMETVELLINAQESL